MNIHDNDDSSGDHFLSMALNSDANEETDDNSGGKPAASAETTTPALEQIKSIWEDDMALVDKSKKRWMCLWGKCLFLINATKVVAHLLKTMSELQTCSAKMDDLHFN